MILEILFQTALYTPMILGIYLSFKILKLTDLTADGSFVLGAVVYARLISEKFSLVPAVMGSIVGGALVGFVLSIMQRNGRILPIVSSILGVFMLYSINLLIAGRPTVNLLYYTNALNVFETPQGHIFLPLVMLVFTALLAFGLHTSLGLKARAFGCNKPLLNRYGYRAEGVRLVGLGLSNALYAVSGLLYAHMHKFADITMGTGVALIGIGAVTIGLSLRGKLGFNLPQFRALPEVLFCLFGLSLYFALMTVLLHFSLNPIYVRFALGVLLTLTLLLRSTKEHL